MSAAKAEDIQLTQCLIILIFSTMEENKNREDELQSRREFFKKAAKAALPILGAVVLSGAAPQILNAATPSGCSYGCMGSCYSACANSCRSFCTEGCKNSCQSGCKMTCANRCNAGSGY